MKDEGRKKLDKDGVMSDTVKSDPDGEQDDGKRFDSDSPVVFEEDVEEIAESGMKEKLKKLRDEFKVCRREKGEYLAGWQRAKADLVNERRDEESRRVDFVRFEREKLLVDIIPVLDSFEQAIGNKEAWEKTDENWRKGVEYIHSQLLTVLKNYGGEPFDPNGEPFDPSRHDSLKIVSVDGKEKDHTVVEVLQKGYLLDGKVIRPAKVNVGEYKS